MAKTIFYAFFDINDDDAWLNVYVIVRYKVKHKNMFSQQEWKKVRKGMIWNPTVVFIRFEVDILDWRQEGKRIIMLTIARQFHWVAAAYMTLRHFHDVKLQKKESEHHICAHGRKISNGVMYYFMAWAAIKRMKCLISFPVQHSKGNGRVVEWKSAWE